MRRAFERTTTIDAGPDEVWRTLVDWEAAPRWMGGVEAIAVDGPTAVGAQVTFTARGRERHSEIVEVEPGRRVVLRSTQGPVTADYTYEVAGDAPATTVTLLADCAVAGPMTVLAPLLRRAMARTDRDQLDHLRDVLEGAR